MIDIIGDIHGHADHLEALLKKLGYSLTGSTYKHPERKVLFVGDYIDRGPKIRETLAMVKAMVESENAIALMGNHEYNALCFHYKDEQGGHLRPHLIKNIVQHYDTLKQFKNKQSEYEEYLGWFKTLPLFFENEQFRAVHACWDAKHIAYLKNTLNRNRLNDKLIYESVKEGTELNEAIEISLKGKELKIPAGSFFTDKDGITRTELRIKWWENPEKMSYKNISIEPIENLPDQTIETSNLKSKSYYSETDKKVFFGHYWLNGEPLLYKPNICCLDYSVAKGGKLVAYRLDDEIALSNSKLVYV
jgi:hypothetical protein